MPALWNRFLGGGGMPRAAFLQARIREISAACGAIGFEGSLLGAMLPRERVALVLDPGSPFIELSTLAVTCSMFPTPTRASRRRVDRRIGFGVRVRCMVSANDIRH